ncbi:MAG: signal peptidase I [Nocardioides sp.]|nr:signal peptidase I [Nocardioides sp.]
MARTDAPRRRRSSTSPGARVANVATNLMIVVVMAVALMLIVPALMGLQRYVITSGSMTGTYDIGSVVFSEEVPVAELEVGDVITYVPPAESGIDHLVTHRIVSIEDGEFRTQGDASAQVDPWTFQLDAATQPRAVASVPYVGYLFIALADRTTRMVVIGLPATLIALLALLELVRAVRRPEDEDETVTVTVTVPTPRDPRETRSQDADAQGSSA